MAPDFPAPVRSDLGRSGLTEATITAARLRVLAEEEKVAKLGRRLARKVEHVLEFPYDDDAAYCRWRLYPPVGNHKYHQTPGTAPRMYVPPGVRPVLVDPAVPLEIIEGEKKSLKAVQEGIVCVGIAGLWNWLWREKPDQPSKAIPDLGGIDWVERAVVVVPDSDVWTRPDLLRAVYALGKELERRGARVTVRKLPAAGESKVGLDEYLCAYPVAEYDNVPRLPLTHTVFANAHEWWRGWSKKRRAKSRQETSRESAAKTERFHLTDLGNAERLVARFGEEVRYVPEAGWFVWDGARWLRDEGECEVTGRAQKTVRAIYEEASRVVDDVARRELVKHAQASERRERIAAMIALAKPLAKTTLAAFDRDRLLLNVANGTLDLRTGTLKPHCARNLITKIAPTAFDSNAEAPRWNRFLKDVMQGNTNLIGFLQRAVGYALTGDTSEQVFFMLFGDGANGKSTFLNTITTTLGDYAMQAASETLLLKREGRIPNDIARLKGARFVTAMEVSQGRRLDDALVKHLTGGDPMPARFLHREFFEFIPECKFFIATNHKPRISGSDEGIWRRVRLVPFEAMFTDPDRALPAGLKDEAPGILAWAVAGYQQWRAVGLAAPPEITGATSAYRAEEDVIARFIEDCCIRRTSARTKSAEIYDAYRRWCERIGESPLSQTAVGKRLAAKGFTDVKSNGVKVWTGIALHPATAPEAEG